MTLALAGVRAQAPVPPATSTAQAPASRARLAFQAAMDSYQKGEYEYAAAYFQQAQAGQEELSAAERTDLQNWLRTNNTALQARKEAKSQLTQAETALSQGHTQDALTYLRAVTPNAQFLTAADKQRFGQLSAQIMPASTTTAPPAGPGGSALIQARIKLQNARNLMAKGNNDAAQTLALEADRLHATYQPGEDTPQKVLEDLTRLRTPTDAKGLLAAARSALGRGDLNGAEHLAHSADKASSLFTFSPWGDTPSKCLKDVQAARKLALQNSMNVADAKAPTAPPKNAVIPAAATAPAPENAEAARQMLADARKALQACDIARAKVLTEKAQKLNPELNHAPWWDDSPDKLWADIHTAEVKNSAASGDPRRAQATTTPSRAMPGNPSEDPHIMVKQARELLNGGKLTDAMILAQRASSKPAHWGLFEDSPEKVIQDVNTAKTKQDQEESVHVLAEARRLYAKGDFDQAEAMAHKAQRLHGAYKLWELGDRPQKLLAEIDDARSKQRKPNVPPTPPDLMKKDAAVVKENPAPAYPLAPASAPGAMAKAAAPVPTLPAPTGSANDGRKAQARLLLAEARQFQKEGKLPEARQRALEAQRVGASFGPDEDRPELALLAISLLCQKRIDALVQQASDCAMTGDVDPGRCQRAAADLTQARQLAVSFGLDTQVIDSKLQWLQQQQRARGTAVPEANAHVQAPIAPVQHQEPVATASDSMRQQGENLLMQARRELRAGQTATARKYAEAAYDPRYGVQEQAGQVLRSIDTEEFNQKLLTTNRAYEAGLAAFYRREYPQASTILGSLDKAMLTQDKRDRLRDIMMTPEMQPNSMVVQASGVERPVPSAPFGGTQPGRAVASDVPPRGQSPEADFAGQVHAMQEVKFQKMRDEGLRAMARATERFQAGETDRALEILQDYNTQLREADLDPLQVGLLRRQVEARITRFKILKEQEDFAHQQNEQNNAVQREMQRQMLAEADKKKQIKELMTQYHALFKQGKYKEAEVAALKVQELDPDDPVASAAIYTTRMMANHVAYDKNKSDRENMVLRGLTRAEDEGVFTETEKFDPEVSMQNRNRKSVDDLLKLQTIRSEKEREIYRKLDGPIPSMDIKDQPLSQILDDLQATEGINIVPDVPALNEAGIRLDQPLNMKLEGVALKSALNVILHQAHLTYVVEDEVLKITTEEHARGKMAMRVHPVLDLVMPISNTPPPETVSVLKRMQENALGGAESPNLKLAGSTAPWLSPPSMQSGKDVSQSQMVAAGGPSSTPTTISIKDNPTGTIEQTLIRLITNTIAPQSWESMGGHGTIEFYPLGMALVINQTPDVQEQIAELLQALRRLQDQEVAVEVRFITVAENFYERIGVDFAINIRNNQTKYQPQLVSQQFRPFGFINHFTPSNFFSGLLPAGAGGTGATPGQTFTQDLGIPIRASSFNMAVPPFGDYPGITGQSGGTSLGLAFLSDIEVYLFMEAAQGDQRTNVMQAPKLTMFNGQAANIAVADQQFFVTSVAVVQVGGQVIFVPNNVPIPTGGVDITILPTISADRRFVRLSLTPALTNLSSANVPLFPITTFITPIFEGGAVGQPVPFTQFLQQPNFNTITINTTVNVPDGGTVLMGGFKRLSEGRNEFGPPILSKIPYINRLFKNVGYGRETESLLMMVTPRIIINEEEEVRQVGPPEAAIAAPPPGPPRQ
jgi:type II secretory pathway component GspD/PulD (secretin)